MVEAVILANQNQDSQIPPAILRTPGGRIIWRKSENTVEDNLQLGVQNIQGLLLEKNPIFNELFPRGEDGKIDIEKRVDAKKFIVENIGSLKKFSEVIGSTPFSSYYPYFEGKLGTILQKTFTPWGLDFTEFSRQVDKDSGRYRDEQSNLWVPSTSFAQEIGVDVKTLDRYMSNVKLETVDGVGINGHLVPLFKESDLRKCLSPLLNHAEAKDSKEIEEEGDSWISIDYIRDRFSVTSSVRRKLSGIPSRKLRSKNGLVTFYKKSDIENLLGDLEELPFVDQETGIYSDEGVEWAPVKVAAKLLQIDEDRVRRTVKDLESKKTRDRNGIPRDSFNIENIRQVLIDQGFYKQKLENDLKSFVQSVETGDSEEIQNFRKLIGLFGSSRAVDILYRTHPQFKGIPVETVKGFLSDYLGNFLAGPSSFNIDDIKIAIEHLSDPNLRDGLIEVIKDHSLKFFHFNRQRGTSQTDKEVIEEYFEILGLEMEHLNSETLEKVVGEIKTYYDSLFDLVKPARMIASLKEGRPFPDLNQLINIKEIADKKRMLIADEMGLGKSASAILSKEILGVQQALIVVPSNVVGTWMKYLSDGQGGYFQEGQAPKVIVVDSPDALQKEDIASYEYVIVSQEKLNDGHMGGLLGLDYGMLIVDEVHKLKKLSGVRGGNLLDLSAKVEGNDGYLAILSGTPVPNKIDDLAMLLKLLYPEKFKTVSNTALVRNIIHGDIEDLRYLLIPRMQRKSLAESIEMPQLHERALEIELSPLEQEIYEVLMEDDEIPANEKMRILRQFLLNPNSLDATPRVPSTKVAALETSLRETFQQKDKVVMFVNGYVEGVIRGDTTIFDSLTLPDGVELRIIEGDVISSQREAIQRELSESNKKILLVVSGQTADVGVDFSAAQMAYFYNEPWTEYDRRQQRGRVYREGLADDLESVSLITKDTIEEGIHRYIQIKMVAIEKLLKGIPISDLEKQMLEKGENQPDEGLEVNTELAEYYFSSMDKLMRIFTKVKGRGEKEFQEFLTNYARDYAECYLDLGSRSYQANANRVVGTLIDTFVRERGQTVSDIRVLDIASGPEVLKQHILEQYQAQIVSLDINRHHFEGLEEGNKVVGSFLGLPFKEKSFDYANLALAWHYTGFTPSKGNYERLEVLAQGNRVLKEGGRLIVSNVYSTMLRDEEKFRDLVHELGFRVVEHYTGEIAVGNTFKSHVYTLQKERDIASTDTIVESLSKETLDAIKFKEGNERLHDSRKIITDFMIKGTSIGIRFNHEDLEILGEERAIIDMANLLKTRSGGINNIPVEDILDNNFGRIRLGNRYVLFKKLEKGPGVVVIK